MNILPENFNVFEYKILNPDLSNLNKKELISHYIKYGRNEGRIYKNNNILPNDFDINYYKNLYDDLKNLNDEELISHYIKYGRNEGRIYKNNNILPNDFDINYYKNLYDDLKNLNDEEIISHYIKYGRNEGRIYKDNNILPNDFDINYYKNLYDDLKNLNDEEIISHYIKHGKNEGRIYKDNNILKIYNIYEINNNLPKDFDINFYKKFYKDLYNLSDNEIINHYIEIGQKEYRFYNSIMLFQNFDFNIYMEYYSDTRHFNNNEIIDNYINIGYNQNRIFNQFPNNFDIIKYANNYNLNKNDIDLILKHYLYFSKKNFTRDKIDFINNHKDITYNNNILLDNNIINKFQNIYFYINSNIKNKYNFFNNLNINYFDNGCFENLCNYTDKINYFYKFLKNTHFEEDKNIIVINNENICFEYCKYHNNNLFNIIDNNFDLIQLSSIIYSKDEFYDIIKLNKKINIMFELYKFNFDCFYLNTKIVKDIISNYENNISIFHNCRLGYYSHPYFNYNLNINDYNDKNINLYLSKYMWDSYYRVTSYWNKIYCVNLSIDINKRNNMKLYCNLLNYDIDKFFYKGILGTNLPDIDTLCNMNIFHPKIINKCDIKLGAIGLNITQNKIIKESIENQYNKVLILEDDIYFNPDYFEVLDILFSKYSDIDILYLGINSYEDNNKIFDKIDMIYNYNLFIPKKNLMQKICVAGMFGVLLSNKALKFFLARFNKPITNISDVLLCDIMFDIKNDCSNNKIYKTNYNLNSFILSPNLFKVITNKKSMTSSTILNETLNINYNKEIIYLTKLQKINFKISEQYPIKIFIGQTVTNSWPQLVNIILSNFILYKIDNEINEDTDIVLFNEFDYLNLNSNNLNICINCENRDVNELSDIVILTNKKFIYSYNIYLPYLFISLWERRDNYKKILNNTKEKFCAYMYSYDLQYRVDIYNKISEYKNVDALGKSCNATNIEIDRFVFNDDYTYNDIAVKKYSKYKFVLALENGISEGYITEKLINPIIANSIPIYAGPNDVFTIINKKRIIYVYDFNNYDDLLNYIIEIDNNDNLYNSIVSEHIFVGEITWDNFEEYLDKQIKKSLGFLPRNICTDLSCITKIQNKNFKNIDMYLNISNIDINIDLQKNYLLDYINPNDNIIDIEFSNKINYIDHIVWINLDRSIDRKEKLENTLNKLLVKNTRISAVDGKNKNIRNLIPFNTPNLSDAEIATTLSHLNAIHYLKNLDGNYFMVIEDDVIFDNIYLINSNLENIIKSSPEFDILLLHKIYLNELTDLYTDWNEENNKSSYYYNEIYSPNAIWSAAAYIISKKGIENICNKINYDGEKYIFNINYFHVADLLLFKESKTYVYKYNFLDTINKYSTIHNEQLIFQKKSSLYQLNCIKNDFYNYIVKNKINYINHIVWINLNKSVERKLNMENILKNIEIKNTRIEAIDGNFFDKTKYKLKYKRDMSNKEIAVCLSHIKAISYLKNIEGEYFLICEDDISFENLIYFKNITLKNIIKNAPTFDILMLHKTINFEVNDEYSSWEYYFKHGLDYTVFGAVSYIISRSGINKICSQIDFLSDNKIILNNPDCELDLSDIFLYLNTNTFIYKYNFIDICETTSTIHNNHEEYQYKCKEIQKNIILKNFYLK